TERIFRKQASLRVFWRKSPPGWLKKWELADGKARGQECPLHTINTVQHITPTKMKTRARAGRSGRKTPAAGPQPAMPPRTGIKRLPRLHPAPNTTPSATSRIFLPRGAKSSASQKCPPRSPGEERDSAPARRSATPNMARGPFISEKVTVKMPRLRYNFLASV